MKHLISVIGKYWILFSWGSRQVLRRAILNLINLIHATGKHLSPDFTEPNKSSLC